MISFFTISILLPTVFMTTWIMVATLQAVVHTARLNVCQIIRDPAFGIHLNKINVFRCCHLYLRVNFKRNQTVDRTEWRQLFSG